MTICLLILTLDKNISKQFCQNLEKKGLKKDNSIFSKIKDISRTRMKHDLVKSFKYRTQRFERSGLLNLSILSDKIDWATIDLPEWKCEMWDHGCKVKLMVLIPSWDHKLYCSIAMLDCQWNGGGNSILAHSKMGKHYLPKGILTISY